MLLYQPPSQLQKKLSRITHKNRMQSDPLNKHLVLNTGHPFSVLVRSAGQEHLEGYKLYKTVNRDFTPGEIVHQNQILC